MLKNKIIRNVSWILAERVTQILLSLIIGVLSARYLGPSGFGLLNYSLSLMALFIALCQLGLSDIVIRDIVQNPQKAAERLGTGIMMSAIAGAVSIIFVIITVLLLEPGNQLLFMVTILLSISLIFRSFELIDVWFQANLQSKYVSIAKMITSLLVAGWKASLLLMQASVLWFAFSTTLEALVLALLLLYMYKRQGGKRWTFSLPVSRSMLAQSYHLIISGLMITLYTKLGQIMIGKLLGESDAGIYAAAIRLSDLWFILPLAIINSARPIIMEQKLRDHQQYIRRLRQLYALIIWIGIVVSVTFTLSSGWLVELLYGEAYSRAAGVLSINIWAGIFSMLGTARSIWIVSENYQRYVKLYIMFGTLTNVLFNWLLIPVVGIYGASWATLFAQMMVAIIAPLFFKKTRISAIHMLEALWLKEVFRSKSSNRVESIDRVS